MTVSISFAVLLSGCGESSEYCPSSVPVDLSEANNYAGNAELPFRFPLDSFFGNQFRTGFAVYRTSKSLLAVSQYHAAEDYGRLAGTPVYAMADGIVSYSGPRGGYGWLIIIDHPEMNLYSLYGHLSPSRWYIEPGPVEKGQLIAYLGDSDENGGSSKHPLDPHLHFGVRAGQRSDYSSIGEWRWQAGWIKYCPYDLGWLQPSLVIVNQDIPPGGFTKPAPGFLSIWWGDLLFSCLFVISITYGFILITRKSRPVILVLYGGLWAWVLWFSFTKELRISYALLALCVLIVAIQAFRFIRHKARR